MKLKDRVEAATRAQTNLYTFYSVIGALENGTIRGSSAQKAADRIIRMCKDQSQRELEIYDKHMAAIERGWEQ